MNYINTLEEFEKKIVTLPESILYPIRGEGETVMNYCRYTGTELINDMQSKGFWCIVKERYPEGWQFAQRTIQWMPVILLKNLPHFRETGNFYIAVPNEQIDYVVNLLENFGCKNVWVISEKVIAQMKEKIDELTKSGQVLNWYLNYFTREMTDLKFRIEEQLEVRDTNTKAFAEYRNRYRGKKVVIVAGGPTTEYYKPIPDAIHIGINFAWQRKNISFDHLFTHDREYLKGHNLKGTHKYKDMEKGFARIKDKIFIDKRLARLSGMEAFVWAEECSIKYSHVARYYSDVFYLGNHLYQDICFHPTADFQSTVFSALHFALFTYPKELYLVGCDTSTIGHFYDKDTPSLLNTAFMKIGYSKMKALAEVYYPETKIISVNPVGLKGLFEDIYTDEYKNFKEE